MDFTTKHPIFPTAPVPRTLPMSSVTYALSIIVMLAVAAVLVRGLVNMARGGSGNLSNKLMQARVLLQFVAVVLIVATCGSPAADADSRACLDSVER
jgi:hypothetical protein